MVKLSRRRVLQAAGSGLVAGLVGPAFAEGGGMARDQEEMVVIPSGKFVMGTAREEAARLAKAYGYHPSWFDGEVPRRELELPAYAIDRLPVTNRQFARFCRETGYAPRPHWHGPGPPQAILDHPVVFVNHADAGAYARWAGKRLPTEAEWEKAARGADGRLFPWGGRFDPEACCWNRAGRGAQTDPVTAHPRGASPYGVLDLVGNAAEWCADQPGPPLAVLKGGCWLTATEFALRPAARSMTGWAANALPFYGFRCVKEVR